MYSDDRWETYESERKKNVSIRYTPIIFCSRVGRFFCFPFSLQHQCNKWHQSEKKTQVARFSNNHWKTLERWYKARLEKARETNPRRRDTCKVGKNRKARLQMQIERRLSPSRETSWYTTDYASKWEETPVTCNGQSYIVETYDRENPVRSV